MASQAYENKFELNPGRLEESEANIENRRTKTT
jgi:hypothetical protein